MFVFLSCTFWCSVLVGSGLIFWALPSIVAIATNVIFLGNFHILFYDALPGFYLMGKMPALRLSSFLKHVCTGKLNRLESYTHLNRLSHISGTASTCAELSLKKLVMVLWPFFLLYLPFCFNWRVSNISVLISSIHLTSVAVLRVVMCFVKFRRSIFSVCDNSDLGILRYWQRDYSSSDLWRLCGFVWPLSSPLWICLPKYCVNIFWWIGWLFWSIQSSSVPRLFYCRTCYGLPSNISLGGHVISSKYPGSFLDYVPVPLLSLVYHPLG